MEGSSTGWEQIQRQFGKSQPEKRLVMGKTIKVTKSRSGVGPERIG